MLRQYLLPLPDYWQRHTVEDSLPIIGQQFPSIVTTAAYVIMSDGDRAVVFEKDRASAVTILSEEFVVATNHDAIEETSKQDPSTPLESKSTALRLTGMEGLIEESIDRKGILCNLWKRTLRSRSRGKSQMPNAKTKYVRTADIIKWLNTYPITNEETHYATIMDPKAGVFIWTHRYIVSPMNEDEPKMGRP